MRLVIVSNRLPLCLDTAGGKDLPQRSIGGLVTGIEAYTREIRNGNTVFSDFLWIGWPGAYIPEERQEVVTQELKEQYRYCPVFLDDATIEGFYNSYCNKVLWPLFHYFPSNVERSPKGWSYYEDANRLFYQVLQQETREDDFVWIHDYHLMLLPAMIRKAFTTVKISFFLHIPFPAFDIFRQLPVREQAGLLTGLLGADTVAVHADEYRQHLLRSYRDLPGLSVSAGGISQDRHHCGVEVFPMGICYQEIHSLAASAACSQEKKVLKKQFGSRKIILSVDRLDYTKGIVNRLEAFRDFLFRYPEWRDEVVLLLIVAPSRRGIDAYLKIKNEIDLLTGLINGEFGTCSWTPVIYQYRQLDLPELCTLYGISDVALVTPLRDGMNLIAKEFIATNNSRKAALILSEFAGAAAELPEAIIVNPYNIEALTQAIHTGLLLPPEQKHEKNQQMKKRTKYHDVLKWATGIVDATMNRYVHNHHVRLRRPEQATWQPPLY